MSEPGSEDRCAACGYERSGDEFAVYPECGLTQRGAERVRSLIQKQHGIVFALASGLVAGLCAWFSIHSMSGPTPFSPWPAAVSFFAFLTGSSVAPIMILAGVSFVTGLVFMDGKASVGWGAVTAFVLVFVLNVLHLSTSLHMAVDFWGMTYASVVVVMNAIAIFALAAVLFANVLRAHILSRFAFHVGLWAWITTYAIAWTGEFL